MFVGQNRQADHRLMIAIIDTIIIYKNTLSKFKLFATLHFNMNVDKFLIT